MEKIALPSDRIYADRLQNLFGPNLVLATSPRDKTARKQLHEALTEIFRPHVRTQEIAEECARQFGAHIIEEINKSSSTCHGALKPARLFGAPFGYGIVFSLMDIYCGDIAPATYSDFTLGHEAAHFVLNRNSIAPENTVEETICDIISLVAMRRLDHPQAALFARKFSAYLKSCEFIGRATPMTRLKAEAIMHFMAAPYEGPMDDQELLEYAAGTAVKAQQSMMFSTAGLIRANALRPAARHAGLWPR